MLFRSRLKIRLQDRPPTTSNLSSVTVRIVDSTDQAVLTKTVAAAQDGMTLVSDDTLDTLSGNHTLWVKPVGYLASKLTNVPATSFTDGTVNLIPEASIGDFNGDGEATRADWEILIKHIRHQQTSSVLTELFGDRVPLRAVVDTLRNIVNHKKDA